MFALTIVLVSECDDLGGHGVGLGKTLALEPSRVRLLLAVHIPTVYSGRSHARIVLTEDSALEASEKGVRSSSIHFDVFLDVYVQSML